ncbi:tRNA adenosine deaminase-associated protein [Microlunatus soli]|uniref:Putative tRNA adenosine deaminase-associated protein n=1 Tax=Microlunatus soli TaxID=630515 RepID=A0A1H1T852_9ACTN|nr:tRNA adenosine deaminase-associated protein [Microlunatus soli]SDS56435.1 putative tRNA adenosine deaminase-associated protein [Microlunatus soli]
MADIDEDQLESFGLDDEDPRQSASSRDLAEVDDEDDSDDDLDDLEDAEPEDIDFIVAAYREDGQSMVNALSEDLANDLDEFIVQLRRLPGDGGAVGLLSLVGEVAVIVRVRGRHVQVMLSDSAAANDWPIARDIAEFLDEDIAEEDDDDDSEPIGDLGILKDLGLPEFDLTAMCDDLDLGSDQLLTEVADKIKIGPQFRKVVETEFGDD